MPPTDTGEGNEEFFSTLKERSKLLIPGGIKDFSKSDGPQFNMPKLPNFMNGGKEEGKIEE